MYRNTRLASSIPAIRDLGSQSRRTPYLPEHDLDGHESGLTSYIEAQWEATKEAKRLNF